jgi:hypothetical protein
MRVRKVRRWRAPSLFPVLSLSATLTMQGPVKGRFGKSTQQLKKCVYYICKQIKQSKQQSFYDFRRKGILNIKSIY